ncbi:hypothetical protein M0812_05496 [Anaeramoeba flamelloides]|uniref:Uncharacterized protein n=1 Tax=Anaeramoeba flamelloides TaxID=1746091 RepID=A0AAV8ABJ3_9EUKA|nr:hypothetical protein M0812_05496 [Anaeramoeba flamelloides]
MSSKETSSESGSKKSPKNDSGNTTTHQNNVFSTIRTKKKSTKEEQLKKSKSEGSVGDEQHHNKKSDSSLSSINLQEKNGSIDDDKSDLTPPFGSFSSVKWDEGKSLENSEASESNDQSGSDPKNNKKQGGKKKKKKKRKESNYTDSSSTQPSQETSNDEKKEGKVFSDRKYKGVKFTCLNSNFDQITYLKPKKFEKLVSGVLSKKTKPQDKFVKIFCIKTFINWYGINLLKLPRKYLPQIRKHKQEHFKALQSALSWSCLGQFSIRTETLKSKNCWEKSLLSIKKTNLLVTRMGFNKMEKEKGKGKGKENLTKRKKEKGKQNLLFQSKWEKLKIYFSEEFPKLIILSKNNTNDFVILNLRSSSQKLVILFVLLVYHQSNGSDPRIGKNPKIETLDINDLYLTVLPPLVSIAKYQKYQSSYKQIKMQMEKLIKNSKKATETKRENRGKGFFNMNENKNSHSNSKDKDNEKKTTKGRGIVEFAIDDEDDDELSISSSRVQTMIDNLQYETTLNEKIKKKQKSNHHNSQNNKCAPLVGSKYSLVNSKNRKAIILLEKKNTELFFKFKEDQVEWDYFSDYAPKQYFRNKFVSFQLYLVVKRQLPFESAYIVISKKDVKIISTNESITIYYTNNFDVESLHLNRLFRIQAKGNKKKNNKSAILLALNKYDSLIIRRTIQYFYQRWLKSKYKKK